MLMCIHRQHKVITKSSCYTAKSGTISKIFAELAMYLYVAMVKIHCQASNSKYYVNIQLYRHNVALVADCVKLSTAGPWEYS